MIWRLEKVPAKWKRGLNVKIPKEGNLKECKNWRGHDSPAGCQQDIRKRLIVGSVRSKLDLDQGRGQRANFHSAQHLGANE